MPIPVFHPYKEDREREGGYYHTWIDKSRNVLEVLNDDREFPHHTLVISANMEQGKYGYVGLTREEVRDVMNFMYQWLVDGDEDGG